MIKISICMVPKSVRFNHILPFHRLILFRKTTETTQQTWSGFSPTTVPDNNRQSGFSLTTVPKLSSGKNTKHAQIQTLYDFHKI